jgi:hypothetical protein
MHLATPDEIASNHEIFAQRRRFDCIRVACDGTHTPFYPLDASKAEDYKNYKGWHSLLTLAFVNGAYMFEEAEIGHAGRNGDPTLLETSWFGCVRPHPVCVLSFLVCHVIIMLFTLILFVLIRPVLR